MKAMVECLIENLGADRRGVYFVMDDHGRVRSCADVPASICRTPDGQPIAADWPAMWDANGRNVREAGLVEVEVVVPFLIELELPGELRAQARQTAVRLVGERGKPAYRLSIVGGC